MDIKEYFARISYKGPQDKPDFETLTAILQHHIRSVPFENLSMHCGESMELDLEPIYNKIVKKNRGGWCIENNQLLFWALQTMGYKISLLGAYVYNPPLKTYSKSIDHLLLKVMLGSKTYIIDGAFGLAYQMWEPMELVSGKDQLQMPGIFRFTEVNGMWYFDKLKRRHYSADADNRSLLFDSLEDTTCKKVYSFTLEPRMIDEFQAPTAYLQTAPDSLFVNKSICSLQTTTGFQVLIGWTFTETTYNYKDNMDLVERTTLTDEEVEGTLQKRFNIRLDKKLVPVNNSLIPTCPLE
ncbi:arylamine N-acetyltransferase, pineal gland isozyme NAT-3-like [Hemicordylus capensis]|uniref:arylamine N-acetyltransferase, pineal gland isozyme NAT-3-like n=1 Tax=Hemicordylus capensis TaxID=884348 RepID=UPI0023046428|nr:arylamine N-acetyltransferase, pineal gland isozyme NAT-3-like [Hemicordylus capensis]